MADTRRTPSALITLLSDGAAAHSTNRQLLRDLLVSVDATEIYNAKNPIYGANGNIGQALTDCVAGGGGTVVVPPGVYAPTTETVVNITDPPISVNLIGAGTSTIIRPTSALNGQKVFKLGAGSTDPHIKAQFTMRGFRVDGINTSGAEGMLVGENAANLSTYMRFDDIDVYNFGGANGRAWHIKNQVAALFINCYGSQSTENLNIGAGAAPALPTELRFLASHFRDGLGRGIVLEQVDDASFLWPIIEGNALEGFYCAPTGGQNVTGVSVYEGRFEGNYNSDAAKYQMHVDGSAAGTVAVRQYGCKYVGNARAIYHKSAHNIVIKAPWTANAANQIVLDTCDGEIGEEQENNSPFSTILTVTNSPSLIRSSRYLPKFDQPGGPPFVISVALGDFHFITGTAGAFTINNPTNDDAGTKDQTIQIKNSTGGALGAVTWSSKYKLAAWVNPATGFSRSITFRRDSNNTNWYEIGRTPADVPN